MSENKPDPIDAERCIRVRCDSKRGHNSPEGSALCGQMYKDYPQWYKDTEYIVFNDTVPFGSGARQEPPK